MEGKPVVILHPVGPLDREEMEAIVRQARRAIGLAVEVGAEIAFPPGALDSRRGQILAPRLLAAVPATVETPPPPLPPITYGGAVAASSPTVASRPAQPTPFARVAVADQDLYAPGQEFIFALADAKGRRAVLATRRLKESFYRRKADPPRQRGRAAREFIAAVGAARGLPACSDPYCVMAEVRTVAEIDRKNDRFCGTCNNLIRGRMRW